MLHFFVLSISKWASSSQIIERSNHGHRVKKILGLPRQRRQNSRGVLRHGLRGITWPGIWANGVARENRNVGVCWPSHMLSGRITTHVCETRLDHAEPDRPGPGGAGDLLPWFAPK